MASYVPQVSEVQMVRKCLHVHNICVVLPDVRVLLHVTTGTQASAQQKTCKSIFDVEGCRDGSAKKCRNNKASTQQSRR